MEIPSKSAPIDAGLYTIPQILSPAMCEKILLNQMLIDVDYDLSNLI